MDKVICLLGPTAAGKTALAIDCVQRLPLEIISVDSALIYREMNIGTAKPNADELAAAPHHLLDIRDPSETYSAADFCNDANTLIRDIIARGKIPFLVGGTMMYFKALQQGLSPLPSADATLREDIETRAQQQGWSALHAELKKIDPDAASRINANDPQRITRALEVYYRSGKTLTAWWQEHQSHTEFDFLTLGLMPSERAWLHQRIALRFQQMLAEHFIDEVKALHRRGDLTLDLPAMRTVGYRQAWHYLDGDYDETTMINKAIAATRQLAKRQMTWLRSWPNCHLLDPCDPQYQQQALDLMQRFLSSRSLL